MQTTELNQSWLFAALCMYVVLLLSNRMNDACGKDFFMPHPGGRCSSAIDAAVVSFDAKIVAEAGRIFWNDS